MKQKRSIMKSGILVLLLFVSVLAQSCATPTYRLYQGDPLPREKIAVFKKFPDERGSSLYIDAVDGRVATDKSRGWFGSEWDASFRIELLPGTHTLAVRITTAWNRGKGSANVKFNAEAGKTYVVKYTIIAVGSQSSEYKVWVEEETAKD